MVGTRDTLLSLKVLLFEPAVCAGPVCLTPSIWCTTSLGPQPTLRNPPHTLSVVLCVFVVGWLCPTLFGWGGWVWLGGHDRQGEDLVFGGCLGGLIRGFAEKGLITCG